LKYIFLYYIFVYIFNLGGFWKGGGHGMTKNKSVGWHTYHQFHLPQSMYGLGWFEILSLCRNDGDSWDTEQAQQFLEQHHAGMDLRRIVSADAASEQQQTLLKATQAMFDLQHLQEECSAANCGLPSVSLCSI
jgi:hypothetical protein